MISVGISVVISVVLSVVPSVVLSVWLSVGISAGISDVLPDGFSHVISDEIHPIFLTCPNRSNPLSAIVSPQRITIRSVIGSKP